MPVRWHSNVIDGHDPMFGPQWWLTYSIGRTIAPHAEDDWDAEIDRLLRLGARETYAGQKEVAWRETNSAR